MLSRDIEFFLIDSLLSIEKIKRFSKNIQSAEELHKNDLVFNAIVRELEILGEALKHIFRSEKFKNFIKPAWKIIIAFRNVIAHDYFGLDVEEIFKITKEEINIFEREFLDFLIKIKNNNILREGILQTINELKNLGKIDTKQYLLKVSKKLNF